MFWEKWLWLSCFPLIDDYIQYLLHYERSWFWKFGLIEYGLRFQFLNLYIFFSFSFLFDDDVILLVRFLLRDCFLLSFSSFVVVFVVVFIFCRCLCRRLRPCLCCRPCITTTTLINQRIELIFCFRFLTWYLPTLSKASTSSSSMISSPVLSSWTIPSPVSSSWDVYW